MGKLLAIGNAVSYLQQFLGDLSNCIALAFLHLSISINLYLAALLSESKASY